MNSVNVRKILLSDIVLELEYSLLLEHLEKVLSTVVSIDECSSADELLSGMSTTHYFGPVGGLRNFLICTRASFKEALSSRAEPDKLPKPFR